MPDQRDEDAAGDDLLQRMLEEARVEAGWRASTDRAVSVTEALLSGALPVEPKKSLRERLVAEIDALVSAQVALILAHPEVQRLRTAWQKLESLVDRIDFDQNVRVEILSVTKEELRADFAAASSVTVSGLYQRLCEASPANGAPYSPVSLIVADYELGAQQEEIELLANLAAAAADAHAPLVTNASPRFLGCERFEELQALGDLRQRLEGPRYASWQSFRNGEDARYIALCVPPGAHALATRVAACFAQYRSFGALRRTTHDESNAGMTEQLALDLSEGGFVTPRGTQRAPHFEVRSAYRSRRFADTADGRAAALQSRASGDLANVLTISRLAHYVEAVARELRGLDAAGIERALREWLPPAARIEVTETGYLRYELAISGESEGREVTLRVAGALQ